MSTINRLTDSLWELLWLYTGAIVTAALVFSWAEGRSLADSFWWAFVTAMTVGYGDISPVTLIGRIDAVILMHFVPLIVIPIVVTRFLSKLIDSREAFTHEEQELMMKELRKIKKIARVAAYRKNNNN